MTLLAVSSTVQILIGLQGYDISITHRVTCRILSCTIASYLQPGGIRIAKLERMTSPSFFTSNTCSQLRTVQNQESYSTGVWSGYYSQIPMEARRPERGSLMAATDFESEAIVQFGRRIPLLYVGG